MVNLKVTADIGKAVKLLAEVVSKTEDEMKSGLRESSFKLTDFVKSRYLSAPFTFGRSHPDKLARGSGAIYRSTVPLPTRELGNNVFTGGTVIGSSPVANVYVRTHVSQFPRTTHIRPTKSRYLAIPLPPALATGGVRRVRPRDLPNSSFRGAKTDSNLLGSNISGGFVPFFVLQQRVSIKSRVHTSKIVQIYRGKIQSIMQNHMKTALK